MDIHKKQKKRLGKAALLSMLVCLAFSFSAQAASVRTPQASGTVTYGNDKATIDASHTSDGYVMVKYTGSNSRIKVRVTKDTEYTYDLNTSGKYETFPLSEGSGTYMIKVFENTEGNKYAPVVSQAVTASLSSELAPFLYPNQFCNYSSGSSVVSLADSVTAGISDPVKQVEAIFNYTVENISYDNQKAASVQNGYLPDIDATLSRKTGICFDYAAVMASMLRLKGIPTKLVIGYAGDTYHAWVSVYIQGQGWMDNVIYFDGTSWKYVDPTFASSGKKSASAMEFISNPANYRAKFTY